MSYQANVFYVMLASPSDVVDELKIAREIILDWNVVHSYSKNIVLLPVNWEYSAYSSFGNRPQEILNKQILKNADLLVGIFWTRIGTPTGNAVSGTVEEIEEHVKSGKPTMLFFSNRQISPDKINDEQYRAVLRLKAEYQTKGLTYSFDSTDSFRTLFQRQLPLLINDNPEYFFGFEYPQDFGFVSEEKKTELSQEAKSLLIEGSLDPHGRIMFVRFNSGFDIQANNKKFNEDNSARTEAKWQNIFEELISNDLIQDVGYKGEIFRLTNNGYNLVDQLKTEI